MTTLEKIRLSRRYGKAIYAVSAVITLAASSLAFFDPLGIPIALMIKIFSMPVILYLYVSLSKKTELYFYLNLGISRKEYFFLPSAVEFIGFIIFMILTALTGYAIR